MAMVDGKLELGVDDFLLVFDQFSIDPPWVAVFAFTFFVRHGRVFEAHSTTILQVVKLL